MNFVVLRTKYYIHSMTVAKIKTEKSEQSVSGNKDLNLKNMRFV